MRANYGHIEHLVARVIADKIPGDFAEIGVWRGATFLPLAEAGRRDSRTIHAVDSFRGLATPGPRDSKTVFQRGALSAHGPETFRSLVSKFGDSVRIHEGYIPDVLESLNGTAFAFVHLDVDHYGPTLASLRHVWPRLSVGGTVACHDWKKGGDMLAAGAINDWLSEASVQIAGTKNSGHCWFTKGAD